MLERFGMSNCKPRLIVLPVGISLSSNNRPEMEGEKKKIKSILYYKVLKLLI